MPEASNHMYIILQLHCVASDNYKYYSGDKFSSPTVMLCFYLVVTKRLGGDNDNG